MKRRLLCWEAADFLWVILAGTLLHFLYDWSGQTLPAGFFAAINESTWEHMKLLFWPALGFLMVEYLVFGEQYPHFLVAKAAALVLALGIIPAVYYFLRWTFGGTPGWINVLIFVLAALVLAAGSCRFLARGRLFGGGWCLLGGMVLWGLAMAFVLFSMDPPDLLLFVDPRAG